MKKNRFFSLAACLLLTAVAVTGCGSAKQASPAPSGSTAAPQETPKEEPKYPTKPIEIIVPFAAGGGTDLSARAISDYLSKEWGQPISVVNKPGAGGATGTQEALTAANDGYKVFVHNVSSTSALMAGKSDLPFKIEDYQFVAQIVEDPLAFVVKADAPWKDLKEFTEWVKQNPDQLTYTSSGPTAIATFSLVQYLDAVGGDFQKARMIVTKGAADSMPKIAGGHAVLAIQGVSEVSTMVKAGKIKILAVASPKRSTYFPDVPTVEEQGIKGMTVKWWAGVSVPKATPEHIVKKWEEALNKAFADPAFMDKLKAINAEGAYLNSADFAKFVKEETAAYTDLATKKGLRK